MRSIIALIIGVFIGFNIGLIFTTLLYDYIYRRRSR